MSALHSIARRLAATALVGAGLSSLGTATAAALAPQVSTGAATVVSQNAATISGSVDPLGSQTTYELDLGTDTTYGTRAFGDAGLGTTTETVTLALEGLAPGTIYHYRLLASNIDGSSYGTDQTFATPGFVEAVLTAPATAALVPTPTVVFPAAVVMSAAKVVPKPKPKARKQVKHKQAKKADSRGHRGVRRGGR